MIINLFKRKNAKPEFEVIKKAPKVDPDAVQKYTVKKSQGISWGVVNWEIWKNVPNGQKRIAVDVSTSEDAAEREILQAIKDHEFNGKIIRFNDVTYEVTVNRFEEKI